MAKGSHKTWGGWEKRSCWKCGTRLVLSRGSAIYCNPAGGTPFSLCGDHMRFFSEARGASVAA